MCILHTLAVYENQYFNTAALHTEHMLYICGNICVAAAAFSPALRGSAGSSVG